MPPSKKKRARKKSEETAPASQPVDSAQKSRRTGYIIASVIVVIVLAILGAGYYQNYVAPLRRIIIKVDDISINMDYFIRRAHFSGAGAMSLMTTITNEQIIKLGAPRYGIEVDSDDVNEELRSIARGESEYISEREFKEWYRQQLNESEFSDSEYKDMIRIGLLASRLEAYLAERMPTVAEHVHLYVIQLDSYSQAEKVRERLEAGESFADLAREVSLDEASREQGGELGWFPQGVLATAFDYAAFSLEPGEVSQPLQLTEGFFYFLFVSEKADAREIEEDYLPILQANTLNDWVIEEEQFHETAWTFNSEINAWISWQLSKKVSK